MSDKDSAFQSQLDEAKVFFKPITDLTKIGGYFKEASQATASCQMWFKAQETPYKTRLSYYGNLAEHFFAWQPKELIPKMFLEGIKKRDSREFLFSISLLKANVFFKTDFASFDGGGLKFNLPTTVYEVQRRKDTRYNIPKGHVLNIEVPNPENTPAPLVLKAVDISPSGASLNVSSLYIGHFGSSTTVGPIRINLSGRNIHCSCVVRNSRKMPADSRELGHRVGVEFINLKEDDLKFITDFVNEEVRKLIGKMMQKKS